MLLKYIAILSTILTFITAAKINKITEINEPSFSETTNITIIEQHGQIISTQNSLIYFFIQGNQAQQNYQVTRKQFESTGFSYLKSKQQNIIIPENIENNKENQHLQHSTSPQTPLKQESQSLKNTYQINFFIVKCPKNSEVSNEKSHICANLGVYEVQSPIVFFFSSNSEILKYNQQIIEEKLFLFISKVQQNSQFFETSVQFDEELSKISQKFQLKNISLKAKAQGFVERVKGYLTWDLLKFLLIFGVLPFLFGYLSSKSQQKASKQRMEKYGLKTEQQGQKKQTQIKVIKKE